MQLLVQSPIKAVAMNPNGTGRQRQAVVDGAVDRDSRAMVENEPTSGGTPPDKPKREKASYNFTLTMNGYLYQRLYALAAVHDPPIKTEEVVIHLLEVALASIDENDLRAGLRTAIRRGTFQPLQGSPILQWLGPPTSRKGRQG